ncbi:hypothetical protein [Thauera sp.]|uniref:DUF4376 domain-containing protein n=1 Tax=Thauera sp. TaxID=1905334 RepID=UPI0039E45BFC
MMYYMLPDGAPTSSLRELIPGVINPEYLSDDELALHNVVRCVVVRPQLEWWQRYGERQIDASSTPCVIEWAVEELPLDEVKGLAWGRVKIERAERRADGVAYTFPDESVGHIQIRDEDFGNLLAIHAAATSALLAESSAPIPFTDREDVTRWLSPADAMAVAMAAFARGAAVHVQSQVMRKAIGAAQTVPQVVAAGEWGD